MTLSDLNSKIARNTEKINIISNGAFLQFPRELSIMTNTAAEMGGTAVMVDRFLYGYTTHSWPITGTNTSTLAYWTLSGVNHTLVLAPTVNAKIIPSFDGGVLAQIILEGNGTVKLTQSISDVFRLWSAPITASIGLRQFKGSITVTLNIVLDGVTTQLLKANANSFGKYRRLSAIKTLTSKPTEASFEIVIEGCAGESIGISGVSFVLGHSSKQPYTTSVADRMLPPGMVIMSTGDTCPPGFVPVGSEPLIPLVSGSPFQSIAGTLTTQVGSNTHHHGTTSANVYTTIPIPSSDCELIQAVDFHNWPPQLPFEPLPGERPVEALDTTHAHAFDTTMSSIPPAFPIRICKKL